MNIYAYIHRTCRADRRIPSPKSLAPPRFERRSAPATEKRNAHSDSVLILRLIYVYKQSDRIRILRLIYIYKQSDSLLIVRLIFIYKQSDSLLILKLMYIYKQSDSMLRLRLI